MRRAGPIGKREPEGWTRLGKRPGPVMWALATMRIERVWPVRPGVRYRAWDTLRVPEVRPMHQTTFHRTLKDAKAHCEAIVRGA